MNGTTESWLSQEAYDRLQGELEHLQGPVRAEIAKRIEEARDEGDLKENGGYHAAKDEQGKIEARIRQLTELLKHATVGEADFDGTVEPGTVVTAVIAGDESTAMPLRTLGRASSTNAVRRPSPHPRSRTRSGAAGRSSTSAASPASLGARRPTRPTYSSTFAGSLHVTATA